MHTALPMTLSLTVNPITAPACKISGLKDARTRLQTVYIPGPITHLLSMLCVWMKILSHASAKKETKKAEGFQISRLYWSFSSDIKAVKGLMKH